MAWQLVQLPGSYSVPSFHRLFKNSSSVQRGIAAQGGIVQSLLCNHLEYFLKDVATVLREKSGGSGTDGIIRSLPGGLMKFILWKLKLNYHTVCQDQF